MDEEQKHPGRGQTPFIVSPYTSGAYFDDPHKHAEDAEFKVRCFLEIFLPLAKQYDWKIDSYVDVGCGSGDVAKLLLKSLRDAGYREVSAKAYDISPHVQQFKEEGVEFICGDFCANEENADLITLFDVFEHVTSPIEFLRKVALRSRVIGLHIPLDDSLANSFRDKYRALLSDPGHLLFMDVPLALNVIALAGLKVIDYRYTLAFRTPTGHKSLLSKLIFPLRFLLSKISLWLVSKTIGGVSLVVVAYNPHAPGENV